SDWTKQSKQETQQAKRPCRRMRLCTHGLYLPAREQRCARESTVLQRHESPRQSSTNDRRGLQTPQTSSTSACEPPAEATPFERDKNYAQKKLCARPQQIVKATGYP